jgi:catechol 2,3-dioxygenase-like lactoylglutathione lyase family enzyme
MNILGFDHCAIVTPDVAGTAAFYECVLGFAPGPRPQFAVRGAWLYQGHRALVHIIEGQPSGERAALEHVAFAATGLSAFVARLRQGDIPFELKRQPNPVDTWQLFVRDPNGVRIEIDFAATENPATCL